MMNDNTEADYVNFNRLLRFFFLTSLGPNVR